jgi:hypothetical protein
MVDNKEEPKDRLPYEKPRLRIITLVAEEVLATFCKQTSGAPGPSGFRCGSSKCRTSGGS